jgi:hypothetical protein
MDNFKQNIGTRITAFTIMVLAIMGIGAGAIIVIFSIGGTGFPFAVGGAAGTITLISLVFALFVPEINDLKRKRFIPAIPIFTAVTCIFLSWIGYLTIPLIYWVVWDTAVRSSPVSLIF